MSIFNLYIRKNNRGKDKQPNPKFLFLFGRIYKESFRFE